MKHASKTWRRVANVLLVIVTLCSALALWGQRRFRARVEESHAPPEPPALALAIPDVPERIDHGRHLAQTIAGCTACHGADLGGAVMSDGGLMRLVAPNLTAGRGGVTAAYDDRDWVRSILEGVDRHGRALLVMPSQDLRALADRDVADLVAFLRSMPAVDRELPPTAVTDLGEVVFGLVDPPLWAARRIDHTRTRRTAPPPSGATRAYGEYLVDMCRGCHGAELRGGIEVHPGAPPTSDLTAAALSGWSEAEFVRVMRTGIAPGERRLDDAMPWSTLRALDDAELHAIWLALRGLEG